MTQYLLCSFLLVVKVRKFLLRHELANAQLDWLQVIKESPAIELQMLPL